MQWLRLHLHAFFRGMRLWADEPFGNLLNAVVLSTALALPWALIQGVGSLLPSIDQLVGDPEVSIFFKPGTLERTVKDAYTQIERGYPVGELSLISPDEAAKTMKQQVQTPELIDSLPDNPLPYTIVVKLKVKGEERNDKQIDTWVDDWKKLVGVEQVLYNAQWVKGIQTALISARWVARGLAAIVGLLVLIVTFNTVRLQLVSHDTEVRVMKALGATDAQVGRPTLWWAISLGFVSFLLAYVGVVVAMVATDQAVGTFIRQFDGQFAFSGPPLKDVALLAGVWVVLVIAGAWLSVRRSVWTRM